MAGFPVNGSSGLRDFASQYATAATGAIHNGPRTAGGISAPYLRDFVCVNEYSGVDPTGVSECSTAINTALTNFGVGDLWFDGTYLITSTLNVASGQRLRGSMGKAIIDFHTVNTTFTAMQAIGSSSNATSITVTANEGDTTLTASSTGFANNDHVLVYSQDVNGSTNILRGEQCRINTASTMTLEDPLVDTYTTSPSVAKISHVTDIAFEGLTFNGPSDNTVSASGILAQFCRNVSVRDCKFFQCHYYGVQLQSTWYSRISSIHVFDALKAGLSYGVVVLGSSQDIVIENSTGERLRHLVTHSGATGSLSNLYLFGCPHRTLTSNCATSQNTADGGFDCHPGPEDVSFIGCSVMGSGQDGIIHQGSSGVIADCSIRGVVRHGINIQPSTTKPGIFVVANNKIARCGASGNGIIVAPLAGFAPASVSITGNVVSNVGASAVYLDGGDLQTWTGAVVADNTGRSIGGHGVQIDTISNLTCTGNNMICTSASTSGYYIRGVTNGTVSGNFGSMTSNSSTNGMRVDSGSTSVAATGLAVSGNTLTGAATGMLAGNTTTGCSFTNNILAGNTTAATLGSGGNLWANNTPGVLATVASGASVTLNGSENDVYKISGVTQLATITMTGAAAGRTLKIIFTGAGGLTTGGNIQLPGGALTASANQMVQLSFDGTNWFGVVAA